MKTVSLTLFKATATFFLLFSIMSFLGELPQAIAKGNSAKTVSITIGKLQEGIKQHQDKVLQSVDQEMTVLEELEMLDQKMKTQSEKVKKLEENLTEQEQLLARKDNELQAVEVERKTLLVHLQKRLRAFYMIGKTGILNVTFSNKNLPELMLFTDAFEQLITYDQSVIDQYRETVFALQQVKHAQELEKALLVQFVRQALEEKQELDQLQADKKSLMKRIKMQQGLYKRALKEMHKEEAALSKTLAKIKRNAEIKKRAFQLNKGKLPRPVKGRLVLSFGDVTEDGLFKGETSKGITVATARGAAVHAVFKGKVAFAGYKRGYGNTVVIDHGFKYFTVTSHLDTIVVEAGDKVKKGALLGSTGDTATLFTKGLYFEVRVGSKQKNPLKWLKPGSY